MKKLLSIILLALGLATPVAAQTQGITDYTLAADWDADSPTYTAPCFTSLVGNIFDQPTPINVLITTSGSNTTVTAAVTGTAPFASASVGDLISFRLSTSGTSSPQSFRYITAKASNDSITVGPSAINISGSGSGLTTASVTFRLQKFTTSTSTGCWVPTGTMSQVTFLLAVDQIVTTTGIDYKVECRHRGNGISDVVFIEKATTVLTAVGTVKVDVTSPYDDCRLMVRMTSTDDGDDLTTNAEKLNISFHGVIRASN